MGGNVNEVVKHILSRFNALAESWSDIIDDRTELAKKLEERGAHNLALVYKTEAFAIEKCAAEVLAMVARVGVDLEVRQEGSA